MRAIKRSQVPTPTSVKSTVMQCRRRAVSIQSPSITISRRSNVYLRVSNKRKFSIRRARIWWIDLILLRLFARISLASSPVAIKGKNLLIPSDLILSSWLRLIKLLSKRLSEAVYRIRTERHPLGISNAQGLRLRGTRRPTMFTLQRHLICRESQWNRLQRVVTILSLPVVLMCKHHSLKIILKTCTNRRAQ